MAWVKIDDQFFMHPKVVAAGRDARDLYLAALTYTAAQLTDGFVPLGALPLAAAMAGVPDATDLAAVLVRVRLWETTDGGYRIHDYHDYNPTSDEVRGAREARSRAGRRGGRASAASKIEANAQANGQANGEQTLKQMVKQTPTPSPSPSPSPSPIPCPEAEVGTFAAPVEGTRTAEPSGADAPETPPAPKRRGDPRSKHPAIVAVRAATGAKRYPPLELYGDLIATIGEEPDVGKLQRCREEWVRRGYNPSAWTWATEWYASGIPGARTRASPDGALPAAAVEFLRRANGNGHG